MFGGYLLYVILGYYLHNFDFSKKTLNIIYIFGFLSLLLTIILTIYHSIYLGVNSEVFFNYLSPNVMIMSMCVFLIFKNIKNCSNSFSKVLSFFSKYYFGIYLIHGLVMGLFIKFGLFSLNVYLPLLCLILSVLVFITSLLISFLMSKVPFVKWFVSIR